MRPLSHRQLSVYWWHGTDGGMEDLEAWIARVEAAITHDAKAAERERVRRWHATFNAALTGILAFNELGSENERGAMKAARQYADRMHGPLEEAK